MEFINAKTILSKVKYGDDWYGVDYNMNLYRGCPHGCIYCDSRSNCYHNMSKQEVHLNFYLNIILEFLLIQKVI